MSSSCAGSSSAARSWPLAELEPIQIMGYADRLAVRPGEEIAFKVSLEFRRGPLSRPDRAPHLRRRSPDGPGFREEEIAAAVNGEHGGRRQAIDCGSHVLVPGNAAIDRPGGFTLAALVWPTLPGTGAQTILGGGGYHLGLDEAGRLTFDLDGWQLAAKCPLHPRRWYCILASLDAGEAVIHYKALDRVLGDAGSEICRAKAPAVKDQARVSPSSSAPISASRPAAPDISTARSRHPAWRRRQSPPPIWRCCWAGPGISRCWPPGTSPRTSRRPSFRISGPAASTAAPSTCRPAASPAISGRAGASAGARRRPLCRDPFPRGRPLRLRLGDGFSLAVPAGLPSGIYAARLRCGEAGEDHIPFFVLPPKGSQGSRRLPGGQRHLSRVRQQP